MGRVLGGEAKVPIGFRLRPFVFVHEHRRRRQFRDALEERARRRCVAECQKADELVAVEGGFDPGHHEKRFNLGRKRKHPVVFEQIQGFDTDLVPCEHQPGGTACPRD